MFRIGSFSLPNALEILPKIGRIEHIMAQYFTKEGLQKIKDELQELKTTEIRRVTKLIAEAAAFGDLKENAAYHDARNAKSFLLGRIEQLENAINDAVIVEKLQKEVVQVGSKVSLLFGEDEETYHIVAPTEADILKNKISYESPFGSQLMGKKTGDTFEYIMKEKKIKVKVVKIS